MTNPNKDPHELFSQFNNQLKETGIEYIATLTMLDEEEGNFK